MSEHEVIPYREQMGARKKAWQRAQRREFSAQHGYSTTANYAVGGLREQILKRDGYKCIKCGLSDAEHKALWCRPITIDHQDKDRSNNVPANLQTLCLRCHGRKDISLILIEPRLLKHKAQILNLRAGGKTYQAIADQLDFSIGAVWKWCRRWQQETA